MTARKRPTPRERRAAVARRQQEAPAPAGRRPIVRILALLAVVALVVGVAGSALLALLAG